MHFLLWLEGHTVVQTVFSCLYLQGLRAYMPVSNSRLIFDVTALSSVPQSSSTSGRPSIGIKQITVSSPRMKRWNRTICEKSRFATQNALAMA